MLDAHIHLERGEYTSEWVDRFICTAEEQNLEEIWLLEHSYRFTEFLPMYGEIRAHSDYIDAWLNRKGGVHRLEEYLRLVQEIRHSSHRLRIKFGLEVCYFPGAHDFVQTLTRDLGLDFLLGSVHFVDDFAYDHTPELWDGLDVDTVYARYFEQSVQLADSGVFDGIAHPDCIKLYGHKPSFSLTPYYDALADALARSGMYAEQNSGAHRRCPDTAELGMDPELIRVLERKNVPILTASDAHSPEDAGEGIAQGAAILANGSDTE